MNRRALGCVFSSFALCASYALASDPGDPPSLAAPISQVQTKQPTKEKDEKKLPEPKLPADIFDPAILPTAEASTGFIPQMIGDFSTYFVLQRVPVTGMKTTTSLQSIPGNEGRDSGPTIQSVTTTQTFNTSRTIRVPVSSLGAFNIGENESPLPQDRVFLTYSYFGNLQGPSTGSNIPVVGTQVSSNTLGPVTTSTIIPGVGNPSVNLNREIFGFEKTFLDGRASVEVRLPLLQQQSTADTGGFSDVGDLTIVGKYALFLDKTTGNVISAGLVVTTPTGTSIPLLDGTALHSTLLQPFVGYLWNFDRFYIQAFHSVVVPTDPRDLTLLFNDVGANFWLYGGSPNALLTFIVPTVEVHVTTPLNHRSSDDLLYAPDLVAITGGLHVGLGRNSTLTFGAVVPVTGPRTFNVEGVMQFNLRF